MATGIQTSLNSAQRDSLEAGHPPDASRIFKLPDYGLRKRGWLNDGWCGGMLFAALECAHANDDFAYLNQAFSVVLDERPFRCDVDPHEYLCRILIERGEYVQAVAILRRSLAYKPFFVPGVKRRMRVESIKTTLAEALVQLHQLDEAEQLVYRPRPDLGDKVSIGDALEAIHAPRGLIVRKSLVLAKIAHLRGDSEEAMRMSPMSWLDFLPPLYRSLFPLRGAVILARCGDAEGASQLLEQPQHTRCYSGLVKRLRTLVLAELESARGHNELALGCFKALAELSHPDALAFLRASQLADKQENPELSRFFLTKAVELDPQSHWAGVARSRLHQL